MTACRAYFQTNPKRHPRVLAYPFSRPSREPTRGGPEVYPHQNMSDVEAETEANVEQEAAPSSPTAPPPYESIVLSDPEPATAVSENANAAAPLGGGDAYPSPPEQPPGARLVARVTEPVKIGDGMTAHAAYVVAVDTDMPVFRLPRLSVQRRFSDFTWLRDKLRATFPGVILYPLPEKVVTTSPFNPEFLEHRRAGLDLFLRKTCEHPALRDSIDLVAFLQDEQGAALGSAASPWYQRGPAGTALAAADSWWQQITTATESFVAGAGTESLLMEEDPKYLEATEYLLTIEERLRRAVRSSDDVVASVNTGGIIVESFAENARTLGDCEEKGAKVLLGDDAGGLGQAFRQVGAAAETLRAPAQVQAKRLADAFRAPLKRGLALVQAAKEAIDSRTDALLKLQTARARCEQKRQKLESVVGGGGVSGAAGAPPPVAVPAPPPTLGSTWMSSLSSITKGAFGGAAQPSVEELQKESEAAAAAKDAAQERYDALKDRMTTELPRLHRELENELNAAFACAAECFKDLADAQAAAWESVVPGCSKVEPAPPPPLPEKNGEGANGVKGLWTQYMGGAANGGGSSGGSAAPAEDNSPTSVIE